jgi:hypothetical protein
MLTGQVAPPAERYNLREDLRAWVAAIRGLRDNPLVTHLRLAEQRRLKRIPRWRRNLPLTITALGLTVAFILLMRMWFGMSGLSGSLAATYQAAIAACILAAVWLMHGVFNCVVGALGVLGRYHKRPNHLCVDDFTCLSSLTDHEIVTGAVSVLLPPLLWRVVFICCGVCTLPAWIWLVDYLNSQPHMWQPTGNSYASGFYTPYSGLSPGYWFALVLYMASLALQLILTGAFGGAGLALLFISLGRGLRVESFAAISAVGYALFQLIYPFFVAGFIINIDQEIYWGTKPNYGPLLPGAILVLIWFPALMGLALGWARRSPGVRLTLAIASPVLLWVVGWPLTFLCYSLFDAISYDSGPVGFMASTAHAFALSYSSVSVVSPVFTVEPSSITELFNSQWSHTQNWIRYIIPMMSARLAFVLLIQASMLYILSRFAREAVRARRSRGD